MLQVFSNYVAVFKCGFSPNKLLTKQVARNWKVLQNVSLNLLEDGIFNKYVM